MISTGTPPADAVPSRPWQWRPDDRIRCDACPVVCVIHPGQAGACDRHANQGGALVRVDPHVILSRRVADGGRSTPGRCFQVAQPGTGWSRTDIADTACSATMERLLRTTVETIRPSFPGLPCR